MKNKLKLIILEPKIKKRQTELKSCLPLYLHDKSNVKSPFSCRMLLFYRAFQFVENVTLNIVSEAAPDQSEISEVEDGWIAKLNGGSGEITCHIYIYKVENGCRYINTTSTIEQ